MLEVTICVKVKTSIRVLNKEQESQIQSPKLLMSVHDTQIQILTLETGPLHQF